MTAVLPPASPPSPRSTLQANVLQRFVLRNVSWETYEALLADLAEEHVFLTYDEGTLELSSPLPKHEREGYLLARLIQTYTLIRNIPIAGFGRTTWRSKPAAKGLEADECFCCRAKASSFGVSKLRRSRWCRGCRGGSGLGVEGSLRDAGSVDGGRYRPLADRARQARRLTAKCIAARCGVGNGGIGGGAWVIYRVASGVCADGGVAIGIAGAAHR